jgi:short chain dehydrogenase
MSSVLITGASKGIGRAVAVELAGRGHRVIATVRRPEDLAGLGLDQRLRLDVTDQDSVDQAIEDAGEIDVLVSNAGATVRAPLESGPLAEVERLALPAQHPWRPSCRAGGAAGDAEPRLEPARVRLRHPGANGAADHRPVRRQHLDW